MQPALQRVLSYRQACSSVRSHLSQKPSSPTGPGVPQRRHTVGGDSGRPAAGSGAAGLTGFFLDEVAMAGDQSQIALQAAGSVLQSAAASTLHSARVRSVKLSPSP